MNVRTFGTIPAAVLLTVLSALPAAAAAATPPTVTRTLTVREQEAATAYWTRERIAAAPALAMPAQLGGGGLDGDGAQAPGPVGSTPAAPPAWDAEIVAQSAYWQDWLPVEDEAAASGGGDLGTAGIYTYYDVNQHSAIWNIYPHRWVGRLSFTTPAGGASCSATAISGNHIVTAAHCVYDTTANTFFSNWVFVPAYRNGGRPFGSFTAASCTVLTSWVNLTGAFNISTWTRHDVAVCRMNRNSANQTLNQAVGSAGRLWNAGNAQQVFSSGYPARNYNDVLVTSATQYLRACTAETGLFATDTLRGGCFWGRGISGGSWLVQYKPFVVSGQVNSVTSGLVIGQQNLYGARFTSNNIVVLCSASGC